MMKSRRGYVGGIGAAPIAACAGLVLMLSWVAFSDVRPRASKSYLADVRDHVHRLPYSIGPMVGTDLEVMPAAVRMLRPNAILQRTYRDPVSGRSVSIVIVHCEDVRDLAGHYPPICYPNAGWVEDDSRSVVQVDIDDLPIEATWYKFTRRREISGESSRILSFFVLPAGDPFAPNMDGVARAARSPRAAGLGAAHFMLAAPADQAPEVTELLIRDVMHYLAPTIRSILSPSSLKGVTP